MKSALNSLLQDEKDFTSEGDVVRKKIQDTFSNCRLPVNELPENDNWIEYFIHIHPLTRERGGCCR